jgi:DNA polymerase-3 subunit delta'
VSRAAAGAGRLESVTANQPRVRLELEADLRDGLVHAYLMSGPRGSGKAKITRAFAAEILATDSPDPAGTRRRALLDPSPHPDLIWLKPTGMSHAFADVREQVIRRAPLMPFEGAHRVFVIEEAEALNEESQNAMLKTLEEPPAHAHLILLGSDTEAILPTVASRCRAIEFDPLEQAVLEAELGGSGEAGEVRAAARLSSGDLDRARLLVSGPGREIRAAVEGMMAATLEADFTGSPWLKVLAIAEQGGNAAGDRVAAELDSEVKEGTKHTKAEIEEAVRRARRRERTGTLDLSLHLAACWARDWTVMISGAPELAFNADRLPALEKQAGGIGLGPARRAVELIAETRRRFDLNVSEELALESLCFRLEPLLGGA